MGQTNIDEMLAQKAKLEMRIRRARARELQQERQRETRRKVLAGTYMLSVAGNDWKKIGRELEATNMLHEDDRALFGLGSAAE